MRKLLVTGGAGFIGANFVHHWLSKHPEDAVVVLDALTYAGNMTSLAPLLSRPELTFVHGDIRTTGLAARLLREHQITTIVHFAAESHVDRSIAGPEMFLETNVMGTHELLKAARQAWLEEGVGGSAVRFHNVSTDEVYGSLELHDPPFTEHTRYAPNSPYAASKAAADHLVRAYYQTYGLPVTTSHCSNNYGPYQFPEKLIPLTLVNILEGRPVPVYGDGLNTRDWLYVEDHCLAVERVLLAGNPGETYNVGGQNESTNIEMVRLLCRLVDQAFAGKPDLVQRFPRSPAASGGASEALVTFVKDRPGHDRRYAVSNDKIAREAGFYPKQSLESGLRQTLGWYLDHEEWWRQIMDGRYREWMRQQYGSIVSF